MEEAHTLRARDTPVFKDGRAPMARLTRSMEALVPCEHGKAQSQVFRVRRPRPRLEVNMRRCECVHATRVLGGSTRNGLSEEYKSEAVLGQGEDSLSGWVRGGSSRSRGRATSSRRPVYETQRKEW